MASTFDASVDLTTSVSSTEAAFSTIFNELIQASPLALFNSAGSGKIVKVLSASIEQLFSAVSSPTPVTSTQFVLARASTIVQGQYAVQPLADDSTSTIPGFTVQKYCGSLTAPVTLSRMQLQPQLFTPNSAIARGNNPFLRAKTELVTEAQRLRLGVGELLSIGPEVAQTTLDFPVQVEMIVRNVTRNQTWSVFTYVVPQSEVYPTLIRIEATEVVEIIKVSINNFFYTDGLDFVRLGWPGQTAQNGVQGQNNEFRLTMIDRISDISDVQPLVMPYDSANALPANVFVRAGVEIGYLGSQQGAMVAHPHLGRNNGRNVPFGIQGTRLAMSMNKPHPLFAPRPDQPLILREGRGVAFTSPVSQRIGESRAILTFMVEDVVSGGVQKVARAFP